MILQRNVALQSERGNDSTQTFCFYLLRSSTQTQMYGKSLLNYRKIAQMLAPNREKESGRKREKKEDHYCIPKTSLNYCLVSLPEVNRKKRNRP